MSNSTSLFVSIASFRDRDCVETLKSLDRQARNPYRVVYGIVEQNHAQHTEESCDCKVNGIVRRIRMDHTEARGPTLARYLASTLYGGEVYYIQLDSHMRFIKDWDEKLIDMIDKEKVRRGNSNFVFSHYPKSIEDYNQHDDETIVPRICKAIYHKNIDIFSQSGAQLMKSPEIPVQTPFIAAGCLFGYASTILQVPFDPELEDLFVGEEFLMALRFFTHGIDILTPTVNISFHHYTREDRPKYWQSRPQRNDAKARMKIQQLIANGDTESRYALGKARTAQEFLNFMGVNTRLKVITKNFCEQQQPLEFYDHSQYVWSSCVVLTLILILLSFCVHKVSFAAAR